MADGKPGGSGMRGNGRSRAPRHVRANAVKEKPPKPSTSRGRATRRRLKNAVAVLLRDRTFHELRLEDIAREAGVRVSLFYHYFPSKTEITREVLSDLLDRFREEVAARPRSDNALDAIHYANQRMVSLYGTNPGAMRCLLEASGEAAPFAEMWRELTHGWNERIARSIRKRAPDAFGTDEEYLALAYALSGTADSFLFGYFVQRDEAIRKAYPTEEQVAAFLTTIWYRALYLSNPPDDFLGQLSGFKSLP